MVLCSVILPHRATASEEPAEGPWQVSVVPAQAVEVAAEHSSNTKVSNCIFIRITNWTLKEIQIKPPKLVEMLNSCVAAYTAFLKDVPPL